MSDLTWGMVGKLSVLAIVAGHVAEALIKAWRAK